MGEDSQKIITPAVPAEDRPVPPPPAVEKVVEEAAEEKLEEKKAAAEEEEVAGDKAEAVEKEAEGEEAKVEEAPPVAVPSFKEESYFVKDLKESEKKALIDLKAKIEDAIKTNTFLAPPKVEATRELEAGKEAAVEEKKEVVAETEQEERTDERKEVIVETEEKEGETEEKKTEVELEKVEEVEEVEEKPHEEELKAGDEAPPPPPPPAQEVAPVEEGKAPDVPTDTTAPEPTPEPASRDIAIEGGDTDDSPSLEDLSLWGVPLLHTRGDERTDVILLKFLRARDFKVGDALSMLKDTMMWRKTFEADSLVEEEIATEFDSVAYMHGLDKEGHPVCYNHYGVFQDKELYQKTFEDEAQFKKFLRWRIQVLEKGIKELDFSASGVHSMVQITDFKDSPGFFKLRNITKKALIVLQDNYPELVARQIFINLPWYFGALYSIFGKLVTPRSKSKVVVARPGKVTETLFRYISPENVPLHYGGFSRPNDTEFEGVEAPIKEVIVKPGEKQIIELPVEVAGSTVLWDITVVGWEVVYGEEFVPASEGGYTVIIQKSKRVAAAEEPLRNSFKATEPGKVVLTIDATTSRRKKQLVYRHIVKKDIPIDS